MKQYCQDAELGFSASAIPGFSHPASADAPHGGEREILDVRCEVLERAIDFRGKGEICQLPKRLTARHG
ncbi:MAG: hypothetical protein ACRC62_16820 [Microcoleus sp.]